MATAYFYPRPPRGGRRPSPADSQHLPYFYPRPPRGGRHSAASSDVPVGRFLSTPSARRATHKGLHSGRLQIISIHALREEGDVFVSPESSPGRNFYPRPPRGGRPQGQRSSHCSHQISIHALREEGDRLTSEGFPRWWIFLSTPSARRATPRAWTRPSRLSNFYPRPPRGGRLASTATSPTNSPFLSTPSARRATTTEVEEVI